MIRTKLIKTNESESSTGGRHDSARAVRGVIGLLAGIPSRMAHRVSALTRSSTKSKKSVKSTVNAKKSAPKKKVAKKVTAIKAAPRKSAAKRATPKKKPATARKALPEAKAKKPTARRAAVKNVKKKATSSDKAAMKSKMKKAAKTVASKKAPAKKSAPTKKTAPVKKTKAAKAPKPAPKPVENPNKRRPRVYSTRSTHDSFMIGDEIIFRQVRDWSDSNRLIEMKGTLIAMGTDFDNHVNYIEVQFEVEGPTGRTEKQVRRFAVK